MTSPRRPDVRVHPSLEMLSRAAADSLVGIAQASVEERGRFAVALSGGNIPRTLYRLLATECRAVVPWRQVHVFWGDERYVSPEDPQSNYRMIKETLLDRVPVPGDHVHPMPTLLPEIEEAAEAYEQEIMSFFPGQRPRFDLILLGMGSDGHIASLFPQNPVLDEQARIVAAVREERTDPPLRLTLTLPAINHAANVHFLVAGKDKAAALERSLAQKADPASAPASAVSPVDGKVVWWVDEAAAPAPGR